MRHVPYDPKKINYPEGWKEKAEAALAAVKAADDDKKSSEVNKHRDVWADLKSELKKVMHDKCWYTESMQVGTDTDVDHFRPKNSVKSVKHPATQEEHQGYWWRAFDPANYRYSCIVANRLRRDLETGIVGGKADEFPLWDETERAWSPDDNCDIEQYMLVDPCNLADVALITFAENGEATERHSEAVKEKSYKKAHNSILLYHLNHSDFVKERIKIRDNLMGQIQDAERYYKKLGTEKDDSDNAHAYERAIEQLRQACNEKAPFSSFAISMLRPYRLQDSLEAVFISG
jgi:hypothetical protein